MSIEKFFADHHAHITGVDELNRPQIVAITDFRPHFLVLNKDNHSADVFHTILNNELDIKPGEEDYITEVKSEFRIPFYGFTNERKDHLCRIYVRSLKLLKTVVEVLQRRFTLYHEDMSPVLMFLHETNLRYGDFITLEANNGLTKHFRTMAQIRKHSTQPPISRLLKCFIRHVAISQSVFTKDHSDFVEPKAHYPFDRVVAVSLDFAWIDMKAHEHAEHVLITSLPPLDHEPKQNIMYCAKEQEILQKVKDKITEWSPEDIIACNDEGDTLLYLYERAKLLEMVPNPIAQLELVGQFRLNEKDNASPKYQLRTRNLWYIDYFIHRKPFILVEMYTIYEFSTMKSILPTPRQWKDLPWQRNLVNTWWNEGPSGWLKIQQRLLLECELMREIEFGLQMRVELHEIQKTNFTDFSDTANRGEQIRAANAVRYFIHYEGYYINPEVPKTQKPLLVKLADYPETHPPVTSIPINEQARKQQFQHFNTLLSAETRKKLQQKKKKKAQTLEEDSCQGGNVVIPTPGFYEGDILAVLDFASLYPNIIRFINISHDKIVYEIRYNDIPGIRYVTIRVDGIHGIRFAQGTEGIISKVETQSLAKRKEAKKMMECEKDSFLRAVYDFKQQSLKILCNAIYGALGAEKGDFFLALRPLMTAVTAVGRFLQTRTSEYLATNYGLVTVYGDTDSVMCVMNAFQHIPTIEDRVQAMKNHYRMPDNFYTPNHDRDIDCQTRTALFVVMSKLCHEIDNMFGKPIVLEPENIALRMMLTDLKKHYWYQCVESKKPEEVIRLSFMV
jgi:DNA polymerase elongation subunit (family B)